MAIRWATSSGNWVAGTFDGGTLPTSSDDVFSNGFTVTVNTDINVLSLRNTSNTSPSIAAGGHFQVTSNARTITMTGAGTVSGFASVGVIQMNAPSISTAIVGLISGGATANFWGIAITAISTGSVLNTVGSINTVSTPTSAYGINNLAGSTIINHTGDVNPSGATAIRCAVAGSNVTVTGNVMGGLTSGASGVSVVGTGSIGVTGNCTAAGGPAISTTSTTSPLSCTGTTTAANWYAIDSAGTVTVSSPVVNTSLYNAINSVTTRILAASPITYTFKDESGNNKILYSAGVALGNPVVSDVKLGVNYGASGELTGTLAVPPDGSVLLGVPVGNSTGTYSATASAIATEIFTKLLSSSDFNTATSFGKLIKDFLDVSVSSRLPSAGYTAPNNSDITAIKAKTDNLPSDPASNTQVATRASQTSVDAVKKNTDLIPAAL